MGVSPMKQRSVLALALSIVAAAPARPPAGDPWSPLYERRLEVGIIAMDHPAPERLAGMAPFGRRDPVATPLSGNPVSFCVGSACSASFCVGSACLASRCVGSACLTSACGGSGCVVSLCGGSACAASVCGGSACLGSACAGSACGTGCLLGDPGDIS
jgi:hypothetical protein